MRDEQGRPVAGTKVIRKYGGADIPPNAFLSEAEVAALITDADGRWHGDVLPEGVRDLDGRMVFRVEHPDYESDSRSSFHPARFADALAGNAVLVMTKGEEVTGTVSDEAGKPIAGAAIVQNDPNFGEVRIGDGVQRAGAVPPGSSEDQAARPASVLRPWLPATPPPSRPEPHARPPPRRSISAWKKPRR